MGPGPAATDVRAIRAAPRRRPGAHLDGAPAAPRGSIGSPASGRRTRVPRGARAAGAPARPVHQPADRASPAVKRRGALRDGGGRVAPRRARGDVQIVLDARRVETGIDLARNPPAGAAGVGRTRRAQRRSPRGDRRRCELLERTFLVLTGIPSARLRPDDQPLAGRRDDARGRGADPRRENPPRDRWPPARRPRMATVANRRLLLTWVPVLRAVAPRLTGLAGSHLCSRPVTASSRARRPPPRRRVAQRASVGWALGAGEDENDAMMAREVVRIVIRNGMRVTTPARCAT